MKVNVGIKKNGKRILFITDDKENNIGELEISNGYYEHSLREFTGSEGNMGIVSDGSHTFDELYHHRMILFAVICNTYKEHAWKSWKHHDGTMFDDYFIVGIDTPHGQYSYHYHKDNWDYFQVMERVLAPKWDGHKPEDIRRLLSLNNLIIGGK